MSKCEELERAIESLEAQRASLGDSAVDAAISGLRAKLTALEYTEGSADAHLDGERKLVTVMFADLSGFTALSERMDPESVRNLVNRCFESLMPCIGRYGGSVQRFFGDEILAVFGVPIAHENDPERAVRAALDIMDALTALNAAEIVQLGVHIGINTGLAVVGDMGTRQHQEQSVIGDAVNVAKRLSDASERGQILVGSETHRLTSQLFHFEAQDPLRIKGKDRPVSIYRVTGIQAKPGSTRGLGSYGLSSPLVGREPEVADFSGCIQRLQSGRGGILTLIGEAGLGKTRLLAEVRARERDGRICWLEGRTLSYGQTISYWPFQEILREWAGINEKDDKQSAWKKMEYSLERSLSVPAAEYLPYLATLLELPVQGGYEEAVRYLDGEAMGRKIFLAARRFFERLAGKNPLVLVFEDLHWMDQSSLGLLEHLLPLVEQVPLLICCVSRPEMGPHAARLIETVRRDHPGFHAEIRLQPLSDSASDLLMCNLLSADRLPPALRESILGKTGGNPFYIEELLRTLMAMGAVERDPASGRWQATSGLEGFVLPDTVQGLIMARVDGLDENAKQVLRTAAVIGRSFFYRVLRALLPDARDLDARLAELQSQGLIHEKSRSPELEFVFHHALTQEAVYESILRQRRKETHAQVGACIEALFGGRLEEFYGLLAYHYASAEQWEKAQEYLFKVGDQAGKKAADAEALAHYRQAMEAYVRVFGDRWDPLQRALLEGKMGEAFYRRGDNEQARVFLLSGMKNLGYEWPCTRWGVRAGLAKELLVQIGHRLSVFRSTDRSGEVSDSRLEETMHDATLLTWIYYGSDPVMGIYAPLWMLNLSEQKGFIKGMAAGFTGIGYMLVLLGLHGLARQYISLAINLTEKIQNPIISRITYLTSGTLMYFTGEWETAIDHCTKAAEAYWATGDLYGWVVGIGLPTSLWRLQGHCTKISLELQKQVAVCRDAGSLQALATALQNLTHILVYTGSLEEAVATGEEAIAIHRRISNERLAADATGDLGFAYIRQGKLSEAVSLLEKNTCIIKGFKMTGSTLTQTIDALATAYLVAADQASGEERKAWLAKARMACRDALRQGKVDITGWIRAARLQARYEWIRGDPLAARRWWRRGMSKARRLKAQYEIGMLHLEMGERLRDHRHLEQAEAILGKTGATLDWEYAKKLLLIAP